MVAIFRSSALLQFALCAVAVLLSGAGRKAKTPEIQVLEASIHRMDSLIEVDAKIKNTGDRVVEGATIIFRFEDGSGKVITTQRIEIDERFLEIGQESNIGAQLKDAVRASEVYILAMSGAGFELRVSNAGPFPIE